MSATAIPALMLAIAIAVGWIPAANALTFDWVQIGEPGNLPDDNGHGAVGYPYQVTRFETTNAQYAAFLNAVAASDPNSLYHPSMGGDADNGGITRSGAPGSFQYSVKPGFASKAVSYVSYWDALRFVNWLHNGQQQDPATAEDGAYTLTPDAITTNTVVRNIDAAFFLPSYDEWHKAAYYAGAGGYFDFPAGSNVFTLCSVPTGTPNSANCGPGAFEVTDVGAYPNSPSPNGTFDQGGNVWEWIDARTAIHASDRLIRGGSFDDDVYYLLRTGSVSSRIPSWETRDIGFRIARRAPSVPAIGPAGALIAFALLLGSRLAANPSPTRNPLLSRTLFGSGHTNT